MWYDGFNAFNNIYLYRSLPALTEVIRSVVPFAANVNTRELQKLLFTLEVEGVEIEGVEVLEAAKGV